MRLNNFGKTCGKWGEKKWGKCWEKLVKNCIKVHELWGAAAYQLGNTSSRTITEVKQR